MACSATVPIAYKPHILQNIPNFSYTNYYNGIYYIIIYSTNNMYSCILVDSWSVLLMWLLLYYPWKSNRIQYNPCRNTSSLLSSTYYSSFSSSWLFNINNCHCRPHPHPHLSLLSLKMLDILLSSVDAPGGYESAAISGALQPSAMKGLDYGGQATVLNAMKILQQSWEWDHKYAYSHSIACCWHPFESAMFRTLFIQ